MRAASGPAARSSRHNDVEAANAVIILVALMVSRITSGREQE
jgi:hypothetical protein